MVNASPTELRQQFLLAFTRTIIETMASRPATQNLPMLASDLAPSNQIQQKAFPIVTPPSNIFTIPSQAQSPPSHTSIPTLKTLLEDSSINAIECQGPNKPLVLRKQGATILSTISLTEAEIQKQITQWSESTGAPLTNGILRSDNDNLTITAVISELIGSRFMLIRKHA